MSWPESRWRTSGSTRLIRKGQRLVRLLSGEARATFEKRLKRTEPTGAKLQSEAAGCLSRRPVSTARKPPERAWQSLPRCRLVLVNFRLFGLLDHTAGHKASDLDGITFNHRHR